VHFGRYWSELPRGLSAFVSVMGRIAAAPVGDRQGGD